MSLNGLFAAIQFKSSDFKIPVTDLTSDKSQTIVNIIFGVFGAVAVLVITIGALRLILSRGNPEGLNQARNTIIYAAIGLLVTVLAYAVVSFVVGAL